MVSTSVQTEAMRMSVNTRRKYQRITFPAQDSRISSFRKTSSVMVVLIARTGLMKVLIPIWETVQRSVKPMVIMLALMEVGV